MVETGNLEGARAAALAHIEKSEKRFRLALLGACILELAFLVSFILLMERGNKLHLLLFFATVGSYTLIIAGLVVLGTYVNANTQRILKAIELVLG